MGRQGGILAMNSGLDDSTIDSILQQNWKYVTKRILEQMCKHPIKTLHIGEGLTFQRANFVGDSENIFACRIAFSFGNELIEMRLNEKKYNLTPRHALIDANELDLDDSKFVMHEMFYTGNPISLKKNRYGMIGASITPHSMIDAVNQVHLGIEELLINCDLMSKR